MMGDIDRIVREEVFEGGTGVSMSIEALAYMACGFCRKQSW